MARFGAASVALLIPCLAMVFGVTGARGAYVIPGAEGDNCSQQGMNCSLSTSNCLDPAWVLSHRYTPSGPDQLELKISTRSDPKGNLLPVINASWTLKDDGSIMHLKASELQVLVVSTNQNLCVRYSFKNMLTMRSPTGDKWALRSDVLVVSPGQMYRVTVENIPKPELDHSVSSISRTVSVPDCSDPKMKQTQPCIDSGALWYPNISLSQSGGTVLTVEFSPDPLSEQYLVLCRCGRSSFDKTLTANGSRLSTSFPLDQWVRTCCRFHVEIKPFFSRCGNDCQRHWRMLDFCPQPPTENPVVDPVPMAVGLASCLLLTVTIGLCAGIICRKKGIMTGLHTEKAPLLLECKLLEHPTLLLIYSRDHPLFVDVVLKLAAFLQAHCGILVLLDLLDSSTVFQLGLMRWLELQKNKLQPKDKILVLCSRGVQSKWRAMCGQEQATYQPDDLIGPFLSLFLSDMHQPGSMGRYIAAYFDEIASERDVPSFFDIAIKYKLMKHFEELYFRVLDIEKYEPHNVNHILEIRPDEYFKSPSGCQLQSAIEKFHAFQISNPDWFEKGAEDAEEPSLLLQYPQISEVAPVVIEGPKIFTNEVLVSENMDNICMITPELNKNLVISENVPVLNIATTSQNPSVLELQPELCPNLEIFQGEVVPVIPTEDEQERVAVVLCQKPQPLEISEMDILYKTEDGSIADDDGSDQGAVAGASLVQNDTVAGLPWSKANTSGSDQGYSSKVWTEPDSDDMRALLQLQQELMSDIFHYDEE